MRFRGYKRRLKPLHRGLRTLLHTSLPTGMGWGWAFFLLLIVSCARMGSPDGGWYDDTPPRVVHSSPEDKGVNVTAKKVVINFSEYIKLEDAQNKVIVSPPQIEMPEIKATGKRIIVELKDSLKANTTYTIDFSDAISDNNEGNPMGNYTYSFSTGDHIDTLEVSGYCLNAQDLEPIKGILVGLYDTFEDSVFHKEPMMRVSRTNGNGYFTIKGVAPGKYRCFALQDADGDFVFGQKSEMIAFNHDSIKPTWKPDVRQDTIWRDSLHIADILRIGYTHFLPDDVTLLCFQEPQTDRYLIKTERKDVDRLSLYFTYGNDTLPRLRGLNFDSDSAFILEASQKKDTLVYWLADTTLVNMDTLEIENSYLMTDSLGNLVWQTDTTEFIAKTPYAKRLKEKQKEFEKWQKEQEKKKKRNQDYDSIPPIKYLSVKAINAGQISPIDHVYFEMPEPLSRCDTSAIHFTAFVDSVDTPTPYEFRQISVRRFELVADWQPGAEFNLLIDSAAFQGIYGLTSNKIKNNIKVKTEEDYSFLSVQVSGVPPITHHLPPDTLSPSPTTQQPSPTTHHPRVIVQLLEQDKVSRQVPTDSTGVADFFYLKPGSYYMRAFVDLNGNEEWDTGVFDLDQQPEPVYYHPEKIECKQKFEVSRSWNLTAVPVHRQKPEAITKQKGEKQKQLRNRNLDRAKEMGKEYIREKTGVGL